MVHAPRTHTLHVPSAARPPRVRFSTWRGLRRRKHPQRSGSVCQEPERPCTAVQQAGPAHESPLRPALAETLLRSDFQGGLPSTTETAEDLALDMADRDRDRVSQVTCSPPKCALPLRTCTGGQQHSDVAKGSGKQAGWVFRYSERPCMEQTHRQWLTD